MQYADYSRKKDDFPWEGSGVEWGVEGRLWEKKFNLTGMGSGEEEPGSLRK